MSVGFLYHDMVPSSPIAFEIQRGLSGVFLFRNPGPSFPRNIVLKFHAPAYFDLGAWIDFLFGPRLQTVPELKNSWLFPRHVVCLCYTALSNNIFI